MSRNAAINILLMIGVGLLSGSIAATLCLGFSVDAATSLLTGAIAAVSSAALTGVLCRWH